MSDHARPLPVDPRTWDRDDLAEYLTRDGLVPVSYTREVVDSIITNAMADERDPQFPDWLRWWRGIPDPFWRGAMMGWCVANLWGVWPVALIVWVIFG